ncbi:hypothetical protein BG011_000776 [Mortierella polycephala]|uniref:Uncharacterized protein n=1 Tax=Mortierella polycephala TaxID=41804 RepID=A0A9P6Q7I9_9FUNG|nr:hypothetical protein BG011_000776 [Mortierella polycephala]
MASEQNSLSRHPNSPLQSPTEPLQASQQPRRRLLHRRSNSSNSNSTATTSVSYLQTAAAAVIANAHQTYFQHGNDSQLSSSRSITSNDLQQQIGGPDSLPHYLEDIPSSAYMQNPDHMNTGNRGRVGQWDYGHELGFENSATEPYALDQLQHKHLLQQTTTPQRFDKERERYLLNIIDQLEQEMTILRHANGELQMDLSENEEKIGHLMAEQDFKLRQLKEEYDRSSQEAMTRMKRSFDEALQRCRREEAQRLRNIRGELQQAHSMNKDLQGTLNVLHQDALEIEREQSRDMDVLGASLEHHIIPCLDQFLGTPLKSKLPLPEQQSNSIWDLAHGPSQEDQWNTGTASQSTSDIADKHPLEHNVALRDRRSCKTPSGQKCLALVEYIQTSLSEALSNNPFTYTNDPGHDRLFRDKDDHRFSHDRIRKKRYSDSSTSSGKTIVVPRYQNIHSSDPIIGPFQDREQDIKQFLQECLEQQHMDHQKEITRIKEDCVRVYRESLEDVRAELMATIRTKKGAGRADIQT